MIIVLLFYLESTMYNLCVIMELREPDTEKSIKIVLGT